jgi:hypothetical protein
MRLSTQDWPVDFYVKSINTYIQYDSEYWHGLDRSIDVMMASQIHVTKESIATGFQIVQRMSGLPLKT